MAIIKQTNGKYLVWNYADDSIKINLSNEDIINIYIQEAKEQAEKDMQKAEGLDYLLKHEIGYGEPKISDEQLKEMNINIPKSELTKKIPLIPKDKEYIGAAFATYAKCPSCNSKVYSGIMGQDAECDNCGQMLDWKSKYYK